MKAEELTRAGQLDEALADLQAEVRRRPADARLRIFLFQLLAVMGQWQRALTQLRVLEEMDSESLLLARIFAPVVQGEALRAEVFAGRRTPLVFGEPPEWIGWLVQALHSESQRQFDAARELRSRAFEAAPAVPGTIDDHSFDWLADADSRLGPVFEVMLEGRYTWVPAYRVKAVHLPAPSDLRDLVWLPATFVWTNGGEAPGFIPVRYVGSEGKPDAALRLARKTEWEEIDEGLFAGLGQRQWATDTKEYPLLEVRKIEFAADPCPN